MMPRLGLLVAVVLLVLIGIVMVFSASTVEAIHNGESATSYVVKQAIFAVFGSALALFVYTRDYRSLQGGPYFWVFWGICAALLLAVPVIGTNILGATRWIISVVSAYSRRNSPKSCLWWLRRRSFLNIAIRFAI